MTDYSAEDVVGYIYRLGRDAILEPNMSPYNREQMFKQAANALDDYITKRIDEACQADVSAEHSLQNYRSYP